MKHMKMEIQFLSNVIGITDSPIRFETDSNMQLRILDLKFLQIISCDEAEKLKQSAFLPKYAEVVYFRRSSDSEFKSLSNFWTSECIITTYITAIALAAAVLVLILIIIIVALFYRFLGKKQPTRPIPMVIPGMIRRSNWALHSEIFYCICLIFRWENLSRNSNYDANRACRSAEDKLIDGSHFM